MLEGRDLDRLERRAHANLMKLNKAKCMVWHMGWKNQKQKCRLGGDRIESSPGKKDSGLLVDKKLKMTQKCASAVQKANCVLGCIQSSARQQGKGVDSIPLLGPCEIPAGVFHLALGPQHKKDMVLLESIQGRATNMIRGLEHIFY